MVLGQEQSINQRLFPVGEVHGFSRDSTFLSEKNILRIMGSQSDNKAVLAGIKFLPKGLQSLLDGFMGEPRKKLKAPIVVRLSFCSTVIVIKGVD